MKKENKISRKEFIKNVTITGAGLAVMPFSIVKGVDDRKVRIGMIGVGGRGTSHVMGLIERTDIEIPAVCDIRKEHAERAKLLIMKAGQKAPELYTVDGPLYEQRGDQSDRNLPELTPAARTAYKRLLARDDLDAVIIATPWRFHVPIAVDAMKAGKYVGVEVPAAYTVDQCWDLVKTSESTGVHCMFLENVCYRRDVMAILNMVRQGLFGEMIHARCGYQHNLLPSLINEQGKFGVGTEGEEVWRTYHHLLRNGDLYPTHGIGPVAQWLDINTGNRFMKLTSTATKARGIHNRIVEKAGPDSPNASIEFKHGDVVTSTITTANGESIIATNNTSLPRPYSLGFRCQGTNGLWEDLNKSIYLKSETPNHEQWQSFELYQQKYDAPLFKKHEKQAIGSSEGGMDWFVRNAFVESVKQKVSPPIDVYDAAAWSVIGPLSEESIAKGGAPVEFPDFTDGKWMHNNRIFKIDD